MATGRLGLCCETRVPTLLEIGMRDPETFGEGFLSQTSRFAQPTSSESKLGEGSVTDWHLSCWQRCLVMVYGQSSML